MVPQVWESQGSVCQITWLLNTWIGSNLYLLMDDAICGIDKVWVCPLH